MTRLEAIKALLEKMFKRIRQFFCRHHFTPNKFVALNHRGWTETCTKCGKWRSHDA